MSRSKKDRRKRASRLPSRALPSGVSGRGTAGPRGRSGGQCPPYAGGPRGSNPAGRRRLRDALHSAWPVVRFVGSFGAFLALFYVGYLPFTQTDAYQSYLALIARASGTALGVLGQDITVAGQSLFSPAYSIQIVMGCDGIEATALFAAGVLALPVRLRSRLLCMLVGTVVLTAINLFRIVTVFCVGVYFPDLSDTVHWDVWPAFWIVATLSCWLIWAHWAVRREGLPANVPA